ncbi:MAG: cysteine hydrolase [Acetobacteraceae bacterium]|nr:cysteine hydrolase [Acetobacteraceae bacterium]
MRLVNGTPVRETLDELLEPSVTALLLVDVQNDFCHPAGHFARHRRDISHIEATLPAIRRLVTGAQALGIPTVFIRQCTLPDGASDSPAWLRFKTRDGKSPEYTLRGSWGWELVDGLRPGPGDTELEKFRPDAFVRTDLERRLRAMGVESVVVAGTTTEGCVESTVRGASYHDFYVVVAEDAVCSTNPTLHAGSMRLFEARYPLARVDDILERWRRAPRRSPPQGAAEAGRAAAE